MLDLYLKFKVIKKMGYIKSCNNQSRSAGITFEKLVGKEQDEFFVPDYKGIEIKAKKGYSKSRITLFSANPDSMYLYALKNLVETYGVDKKRFITELSSIVKHRYNGHYFQIFVDWENKRVVLLIFDRFYNLISDEVYWTFSLLEERINLKLKKLALVKCCTKRKDKVEYYWYYCINFYKNINFLNLLMAIEKGIITIRFKLGPFLSGPRKGEIHNHGIDFAILENDLKEIYDPVFKKIGL